MVDFVDTLRTHVGRRFGPVFAWDRVDEAMIRQWREAIGCEPVLTAGEQVAPSTMLPVWLMPGVEKRVPPGSDTRDHREIMGPLEAAGYIGILGTNCEQDYVRSLRPGERISSTFEVESVSDEKVTNFGPGFFITFLQRFSDEDGALVGTMRLRILRFRPKAAGRPAPPQPAISQDTAFFWEGLRQNRLLVQRCTRCGLLRHPPGPSCTACHSLDWDTQDASGRGEIYSFVVMHQPKYDAFAYPHPVGLVELEEGVRLVAPLDVHDPADLDIGQAVEIVFQDCSKDYRLPHFRPCMSG